MKYLSSFPVLHAAVLALMLSAFLVEGYVNEPDRGYKLAGSDALSALVLKPKSPMLIEFAPLVMAEEPEVPARRNVPDGEVGLRGQRRWSSSFKRELQDALASGVAARLEALDANEGARPVNQPIWRISVQVRRFDAVEDTRIEAALSWVLQRPDIDRSLHCEWSHSEFVKDSVQALSQGVQRVVDRAADAISQQLEALRMNPEATCTG
ncbi:PqiC family protein [Variovorax sp. RT4R15]|uniref:PqiC family protein n=1 Tax=Variovorax sp. RT4R15 TaxID=3443737 RepID=UPI003F44581D